MTHSFRQLPSVARVLSANAIVSSRCRYPHARIVAAIRSELAQLRSQLSSGVELAAEMDCETIAVNALAKLNCESRSEIRTVINATGVVLHTNLGRSPLHPQAAQAALDAAVNYLNLEMNLATGKRSSRQNPIRTALQAVTGAESGTAVNNCAAATVIVLRTVAAEREVIVSRGQLIEIGGGFRIPDIMAVSGATLREVGTTNITRLADYERAIGPKTAALMRIHTSNYRIRGFTRSVELRELVALGHKYSLPVIDDVGSGQVLDLAPYGLRDEPLVLDSVAAGADVVLFSGDKLLGGPQAGLIVGRESRIRAIEEDPLMRAFRLDKMTLAALEATLRLYRDPGLALHEIPTLRMLTTPLAELHSRSQAFATRLQGLHALKNVAVRQDTAAVGGGSLPDVAVPTYLVTFSLSERSESDVAQKLRIGSPAVISRLCDGQIVLDLRTVFPDQEQSLYNAIDAAVNPHPAAPGSVADNSTK